VLCSFSAIDAGTLSREILQVEATSQLGTAQYIVELSEAEQNNDVWSWFLPAPVELLGANDQVIATLEGASLDYVADPQISLSFVGSAGDHDTTFTITSATLSFPTLNPAEGRASAGVTVMDVTGDGASLTGNIGGGGKSYRAIYDGGTVFADLVNDDSTAVAFGTLIGSDASPASGFSPIAGGLSSMMTEFHFTIEARDSVSVTSLFITQVPEPSSLVLALFGCFVVARGLGSRRLMG
jgi:hypothetical protein